MMIENKAFKVAGVKNLMKINYGVSPDLIDVEAHVDDSLSMSENWYVLKPKVLMLCSKPHKILFDNDEYINKGEYK